MAIACTLCGASFVTADAQELLTLSLEGPRALDQTLRATYRGRLTTGSGPNVIGVPGQLIEILVDASPYARTLTLHDGTYSVSDGTVSCWGDNSSGQLGGDSRNPSSAPVRVQGLVGAVAITAGAFHTCALLADGTASCWGSNNFGQLGIGRDRYIDQLTPQPVSLSGAMSIEAGADHTCAMHADGTASCWGANASGQLGNGTLNDALAPIKVVNLP